MKVILVDDDPTMHVILRKMLVKLPQVQVEGAFTDTKSAAFFLGENSDIGLALVDISMKEENGLEFAAKLASSSATMQVVFVTSHKDFALEAYELSVLDYLVKPVSQERLQRAVNRALANWQMQRGTATQESTPPEGRGLIISALGDLSVSNESGRVKWISRKCTELFAYLLLYRGRRIPRSRLINDIFGGMLQTKAENYLNTTVYQLRKSLDSLGMREAISSENDGYLLVLKEPIIDYVEFEQQVNILNVIEAGNVTKAMQIEQLYTGDLFGDKGYVWASHETIRYASMYASFVVKLAAALISLQDLTASFKLLLKLKDHNPLDESVVRLLMSVRERIGDKKGLNTLYSDYVRLLNRELGIRPSEEFTQYYNSLMIKLSDQK